MNIIDVAGITGAQAAVGAAIITSVGSLIVAIINGRKSSARDAVNILDSTVVALSARIDLLEKQIEEYKIENSELKARIMDLEKDLMQ